MSDGTKGQRVDLVDALGSITGGAIEPRHATGLLGADPVFELRQAVGL
jgi:hypothetical protein